MRLTSCTLVVKGIINRWGVPLINTSSQGPELARCGQVTLQEKLTGGGGYSACQVWTSAKKELTALAGSPSH